MSSMDSQGAAAPAQGGPVKRACDCCHRRKIKCILDGQVSCRNCSAAGLACTYNSIPQKKGPKGSRAKIISDLREAQQHPGGVSPGGTSQSPDLSFGPRPPPSTSSLLTPELVEFCVEFYLVNIYPSQPLLDRGLLRDMVDQAQAQADEPFCLVAALCSYVLVRSNAGPPPSMSVDGGIWGPQYGVALLNEALRRRKRCLHVEEPTTMSAMISFFVFSVYFSLEKDNSAWFYLREATTLALTLRLNEADVYATLQASFAAQSRTLYWLLFVSERAFALHRRRPVTLSDSITPPPLSDGPTTGAGMTGFVQLIELFRPFDSFMIAVWNKSGPGCDSTRLVDVQQRLTDALPLYLASGEVQAVDLRITQQWLKTIVWQLAIRHGLLSSQASQSSMTFDYPVALARDLLGTIMAVPTAAMEVHGIGLVEKLFDIACTLIDVMACVPLDQAPYRPDLRDYLQQYLNLIASLRGGRQRFLPLLHAKMNDILPTANTSVLPIHSNHPHTSSVVAAQTIVPQHPILVNDDIYESNSYYSSHGSGATSAVPSPFGSPPHSAALPHLRTAPQHAISLYPFEQAGHAYGNFVPQQQQQQQQQQPQHQQRQQQHHYAAFNVNGQVQTPLTTTAPISYTVGDKSSGPAPSLSVYSDGSSPIVYSHAHAGDVRYAARQELRPT